MNRSCLDFAHLLVIMVRDIVDEATRSFFVMAEAPKTARLSQDKHFKNLGRYWNGYRRIKLRSIIYNV
jgi:hypothetical protein